MAPLETDAADQMRNFYEITKRGGPIGHRESSIIAGDACPEHDHKKGKGRGEDRERVVSAVIGSGDGLQNELLGKKLLALSH
ncbi:MAG: hypothetical protein DMG81_08800 [Acidobacteria bacterium]|nr:MAG: hypothetical protein DMG81_08800 [Acidobacteriota bacterium]